MIITDVQMPVMNGLEVIHYIRSTPYLAHIPIFVLSVYGHLRTKEAGKQAGANDFFIKPVNFYQLIARIAAITSENTQTR